MNRPITVVQYWAGYPRSRTSKWQRFLALMQRCRELGWRSYLVWSKMPEDVELVEPFQEIGCEILLRPPSRGNFDVASIRRVYKLLRHVKCDLFHCHNDHTSPLIGAALAGVPVRIWSKLAMSSSYEQGTSAKGLHRWQLSTRVSCLCAHRVLAASNQVRQEVVDTVGFARRVGTVPVPVDAGRFAQAEVSEIRRELGLNSSHWMVTTVGHAVPVKGWDIAVRAFAGLHQIHPEAHLVFIGGTSSSEERGCFRELSTLVQNCGLSSHVHFVHHRHDVPEILKASDAFILPSRSEGMPGALIEAMAAGLPCVAARVGGIPEVITHEEDGLLFTRENVQELMGHLARLLEDRPLRSRIAARASLRAQAFSMSAYTTEVFRCYTQLLSRARILPAGPDPSVEGSGGKAAEPLSDAVVRSWKT